MPWLSTEDACSTLHVAERTLQRWAQEGKIHYKPHPDRPRSRLYLLEDKATAVAPPAPCPSGQPMKATRSILGIWGVHVPDHDEKALSAVLQFIRDYQPDEILIGGDFLELESASRHGGVASLRSLLDEIKAGKKVIQTFRKAAPKAKFTYLEGNHEQRLSNVVVDSLPTFDGALSIPALLDFEKFDIEWMPYGKLYRPRHSSGALSKLHYVHGAWASKYHASKTTDVYGVCVRYGHVHTAQCYLRGRTDGGVYGAWATPCLRSLDVPWTQGPSCWVHGLSFDEIFDDGSFTANTIVMANRRFAWCGKIYG